MDRKSWQKIIIVTIFAIAMGFLEATVVVYLRKLFYPSGFVFPLHGFISPEILNIEWIREFATIIMLITIGLLAGRKAYSKFAYFIYSFAIWDIFYYVFLKFTLNWPASLFTWDLLFLIPWPWIGPVIAPVLCSILMIITALIIINFEDKMIDLKIKLIEGLLIFLGIMVVLYTWLYDYGKIIIGRGFVKDFFTLTNNSSFYQAITNYTPPYFNWLLFILGFVLASLGILLFYLRTRNQMRKLIRK